jgi:hypothetical protein
LRVAFLFDPIDLAALRKELDGEAIDHVGTAHFCGGAESKEVSEILGEFGLFEKLFLDYSLLLQVSRKKR